MEWQATVEDALQREIEAGHMTSHQAMVLHHQLDRLAFNMTVAGHTGKLPKAVAAAWMLHLHRSRTTYTKATAREQAHAARWWALGIAAGLLRENQQSLAFTDRAVQDYFCLRFCTTRPLSRKLFGLMAQDSFKAMWRCWAEQEPSLFGRLVAMLTTNEHKAGCIHAASVLRYLDNPHALELLITAFMSASVARRIRIAHAITILSDPRTVELLTIRLIRENPPGQVPIIEALGSYGEPALPILIAWLGGLDQNLMWGIRWSDTPTTPHVVERLGSFGESALPVLGALFRCLNQRIVHASMRALGNTGTPLAVEVLLKAPIFGDPTLQERAQALKRLGAVAILPLIEALKPPDWQEREDRKATKYMTYGELMEREYIYEALNALGDVRVAALLLEKLKQHASSTPGAWFGRALVKLRCPESADLLAEALSEQHRVVRYFAALALAELGDRRAIAALRLLIQEKQHPIICRTAAEALRRFGEASN